VRVSPRRSRRSTRRASQRRRGGFRLDDRLDLRGPPPAARHFSGVTTRSLTKALWHGHARRASSARRDAQQVLSIPPPGSADLNLPVAISAATVSGSPTAWAMSSRNALLDPHPRGRRGRGGLPRPLSGNQRRGYGGPGRARRSAEAMLRAARADAPLLRAAVCPKYVALVEARHARAD